MGNISKKREREKKKEGIWGFTEYINYGFVPECDGGHGKDGTWS